jgi:DNA topoisomerase-1
MTLDDTTLDSALGLLELPRELGPHPESGDPVKAGIGRYGPYVVHEGDFRSLTKEDDVLTITLDRALALLAEPKRRGRKAAKPLRELGEHPSDGGVIQVFEGRYGPYVKHEKTNASLPKDLKVEDVTLKQAAELIAARKARGPAKRSGKAGGKTRK